MIGIVVHSRSWRHTSMPSPSGSTRSMIAACGGRTAALSSASRGGRGGIDLEAGVAQDDAQRAQDLRLVVADQDALLRAHVPEAVRVGHRLVAPQELGRELDDEARALARERLDRHAPAVGLHEPAHDREPEPRAAVAGTRAAGAVERLEDAVALGGRDPGPAVDDADQQPPAGHAPADRDRVAARVARAVLEQVGERPLELGRVGAHERQVGVEREREALRRRAGDRRSRR